MVKLTTRRKVFKRDGGVCVSCGTTEGLSLQHRKNKQMGGSKFLDGTDNLIVLCLVENQSLEADWRMAGQARISGHKLHQWEEPSEVAVWYPAFNQWRLLNADGGFIIVNRRDPLLDEDGN